MSPLTINTILQRLRTDYADAVAFRIKQDGVYREFTGREVAERVDAVGARLLALGLKPGDRIGLLSENRPEWSIAYLGIVCHGLTAVPLDRLLKPTEIQRILDDSGAAAAVVSTTYMEDVRGIAPSLPAVTHLLSLDDEAGQIATTPQTEDGRWPSASASPAPDDLAALIYTSGTTGNPKGVMLSHRNIMSNVISCSQAISYSRGDNFLSVLPLHHTFECTAGFLAPLYGGATVTYVGSLKSRDIIDTMRETKATIMLGVPLLYEKMYIGMMKAISTKPPHVRTLFRLSMGLVTAVERVFGQRIGHAVFRGLREKGGFGTIRFFVSGAAALPVEIGQGFERLGIRLLQGYGLTEASPVVSVNRLENARLGSIGPPVPGVEVRIVNPDASGIGEVVVRGDNVMQGYYKNPEATVEVLQDGWLYTGDSGWIDAEGHLHIAGRLKNVIVTQAGKNIYPEEIETELVQSPFIAEAVVVGDVNPQTREETVRAIVVPDYEYFEQDAHEHGRAVTDEFVSEVVKNEIRTRCANLADYKRVRDFDIRKEEFPKTSTRKIKRYLVKERSHVETLQRSNVPGS
ncbi:MAG: long-chain fatty acid--CoA ligase [Candidatus Latescibacteria bacterium]|nr:long-chain fatty acid--CoA ligase [Candidatus Latescibacterota bacterium]